MLNVLIVEDDFRVAQIHEGYLGKVNEVNLVGKAKNALEALKLLEEYETDLILLDVYMPDQLGTDLLATIRNKYTGIHIILITASDHIDHVRKAIEFGVFRYLSKPIEMDQFIGVIEEVKDRTALLHRGRVDEHTINKLFGGESEQEEILPSGIDALTLKKVTELIKQHPEGLNSEQAGTLLGTSRTTARRYLEYLVSTGCANSESIYGLVGRPERKYFYDGQ
ncbi:response regulator [Edaphobacillus lindanitolerans]|uniref:Two-component system, CitB family, response regulator CitT n=1 Tax=Edaphobacillus lindanitolerans TaxID=550447 RepID=A0A1U7PKP6_9BACI|nr:response regulator [Edaphobacillus lindanitolerans]SIT72522.1 two-component system, CitB family, response regulator CitT [Edaphobacillus lindanitolerans]